MAGTERTGHRRHEPRRTDTPAAGAHAGRIRERLRRRPLGRPIFGVCLADGACGPDSPSATPADSVKLALRGGLSAKAGWGSGPDLVVTGINSGLNVSSSVNDSGTVGAAIAAIDIGVPAVAFSAAAKAGPPVWTRVGAGAYAYHGYVPSGNGNGFTIALGDCESASPGSAECVEGRPDADSTAALGGAISVTPVTSDRTYGTPIDGKKELRQTEQYVESPALTAERRTVPTRCGLGESLRRRHPRRLNSALGRIPGVRHGAVVLHRVIRPETGPKQEPAKTQDKHATRYEHDKKPVRHAAPIRRQVDSTIRGATA
ncbi:5'/3'-nucleotidase SurE [Streptomyces sp. NPDC059443]|uniref:5'/3'-nucleotidase SurE n=1 Tax=unclassified Streptomyces TaxID=2593676 RepID=UPI0036CFD285